MEDSKEASPNNNNNLDLGRPRIRIHRQAMNQEELVKNFGNESTDASLSQKVKLKFLNCCACTPLSLLYSVLPVLQWLPRYRVRECLAKDIMAGFTVSIMHIPQGLAYGVLAAAGAVNGLYVSAGKAVTKRNTGAKKESSEESNESDSKESKETTRGSRTRRDDQKTTGRRDSRKQDKQTNQTAAAAANRTEAAHPRQLPPPPPVQCVTPVCEPYCKYRQAEHGCLVCECPDVCPEMVCGAGCQPYFTEASKCQKCLCAPHSRREELAEVFAGFCKEHTLHRMVADFDDFRDILLRLQHRSLELQELIGRAEHARGIHGPVPEEIRASFGRHHHSHHPPLHHQAAHHPKHGHHQHAKPAERHQN